MSGALLNIYNNVGFALNLQTEAMARFQEQISTGSRINRASDDPSAAYRVLGLNSEKRLLENYASNIQDAMDKLGISSNIVGDIKSVISNEKVHLTQIASGTYAAEGRGQIANEINDALEQVLALANTKHMNQYLFGGSDTSSAPYVAQRSNGEITSVTYEGSFDGRDVEVAPGLEANVFPVGDGIFSSDSRGTPVFFGNTGAAVGTGTSSVRGYAWLTVTYNDTTGKYELSIDGGASTVAVEGDTSNLAVTDSRTGKVLYVDASHITATGTDVVCVPGTCDVFNTLISIRDMLKNESGFSNAMIGQLVDSSISSLSDLENRLAEKSVSIGSKVGFLQSLNDTLGNIKSSTEDETATLQQADVSQLALDLSRSQVLYQMSLAVASKLMSLSLLNFLGSTTV
jgi:flagellar hook-associated protein 3 FlgL